MQGDASSAQDPREDLGPHFDDNGNAEDDYDSDKSDDSDDDEYEQLMLLTMLAKGFDDPITPAIQQFLSISAISIPDNETQTAEMNTAELPPLTRNKRKLTSRVTNSTFAPQDDNATHSKRTYREFPATPKYAELRADAMSTRVGLSTWITNVRLTPNEFDILLDMQLDEEEYNIEALDRTLRDLIEEPYNFANEHTDYENSLRETRKRKYSTEEMLYIYLAVMSSSHTDWRAFTMGWKCDPSTIQRIYYHVQRCIYRILHAEISWPTEQERATLAAKYLGAFHGVIGYVNGTRSALRKPSLCQTIFYSGKIGMHCINSQVIVDITGKFIQATVAVAGGVHDKVLYDSWDGYLREHEFFSEGEFLLGDPAYNSRHTSHRVLANPTAAEYTRLQHEIRARRNAGDMAAVQGLELTVQTLHKQSDYIRRLRVQVERSLGCVKQAFPFVGLPGRGKWKKTELSSDWGSRVGSCSKTSCGDTVKGMLMKVATLEVLLTSAGSGRSGRDV
eukprot:gene22430-27065_t